MQAQFLHPTSSSKRSLLLNRTRTPGAAPSQRPVRLFKTPQSRLRPRTAQENLQDIEVLALSKQVAAFSKQLEQLTEIVKSLVSNVKEKSELQQASVPTVTVPAREQSNNVPEHVLLTPQIGRSEGTVVKSLASNSKVKPVLQQARVPTVSARVQSNNVPEHALRTPQIGRSESTEFMRNLIERTSRQMSGSANSCTLHQKKELQRIQDEYRSAIPTLVFVEDEGTTNFEQWNSAFLAYMEVLHPDLFAVCKTVSGMDLSPNISGPEVPLVYLPLLPPGVPDLSLLLATSAIKNTCSAEWKHLIESCGAFDLLPAYSALVQKFSPNSDTHRSTLLANFWTRDIFDDEDIDQYAAQLVKLSNEVNLKMSTEHIKTIDIISNLKRGLLANTNRCDDYKAALQTLNFHHCNQLGQVVQFLKQHCHETPSAKPVRTGAGHQVFCDNDEENAGAGHQVFCDNDEENAAAVYCEECQQSLCADCDDVFHRSKFRAAHKRTAVENPDPETTATDIGRGGREDSDHDLASLCTTKLQEGRCQNLECRYRHDFNVLHVAPSRPSQNPSTLPISEVDASTRTAHHEPVKSTPPSQQVEHTHPQANFAIYDGYPRYLDSGYVSRGY